jgi:hypothetical protein|tara:strand:+ start:699 stop:1148 length:450 start_codon:yes stop_codon:yes gene_type:complete
MSNKALVKALKTAVREVIKEELTDILREGLQSTVTELQTESVAKKPVKTSKPRKTSLFKENKFSDILNETQGLQSEGSYADLMQEEMSFSSADAQGFGMMRNNASTQIMEDPETGKNMQVDPVVAKAMNRDYSALMKAMDKKKNKGFAL